MNENILRALGMEKELERVKSGRCPFCGKPVRVEDFRDEGSRREHTISGLCQRCQDEVFS
jgi:hypothetical protein